MPTDRLTGTEWLALASTTIKTRPMVQPDVFGRLASKGLIAQRDGEWVVTDAGHETVLDQAAEDAEAARRDQPDPDR
jgi:ribosomal protein S19E (S16A)